MKNWYLNYFTQVMSSRQWVTYIRTLTITILIGSSTVYGQSIVEGSNIDLIANLVVGERLYARVNIAEPAFANRTILRLASESEIERAGSSINEFVESLTIESSSATSGNYYLISKGIVREPQIEFVIVEDTANASIGHVFRLRTNGETTEIKEISEIDFTVKNNSKIIKEDVQTARVGYSENQGQLPSQLVSTDDSSSQIALNPLLGFITDRLEGSVKSIEQAIRNQSERNLTELKNARDQDLEDRAREPNIYDDIAKETVALIVRNSFQATGKSDTSLFQSIKLNGFEIILLSILGLLILITLKLSKFLNGSKNDRDQFSNYADGNRERTIFEGAEIDNKKLYQRDIPLTYNQGKKAVFSGDRKINAPVTKNTVRHEDQEEVFNTTERAVNNNPPTKSAAFNRKREKEGRTRAIESNQDKKSAIPRQVKGQEIKMDDLSQDIIIAINFINMGEKEVGREMLRHIIKSGSDSDKKRAKEVLESEFSNEK